MEQIVTEYIDDRDKIIAKPKHLNLKGVDCLTFTAEGPDVHFGGSIDASANAECYRENGNYVSISSVLSQYTEYGKPYADYPRNAQIFEHFLQTLEFKPASESPSAPKEK
ncbi:MAG: hypothetical protein HY922_05910 [Elusimicrobia bacterium]|nr:hypothetical protein [Elusimicrobiota bacterium]